MKYYTLTNELRSGRRKLDGLDGVKILEDWKWDFKLNRWYIKLELISNNIGPIPKNSIWYVVSDNYYPNGIVKIYPDKNSFNLTFEHQSNNGEVEENDLWRKGALCLESPLKCLGKHNSNSEPLDVDHRLLWNVKRAIDWINAANDDKLMIVGDPFELPQFKSISSYCAFSENKKTFDEWEKVDVNFGIAKLGLYKLKPFVYFVKEFRNENNKLIKEIPWGEFLCPKFKKPKNKKMDSKESIVALWVKLKETPVINKWQAPNFLGELFDACKKQDINLKYIIKKLAPYIRDGRNHILLIGFPIPRKIGDENSFIHWQALKLPILSQFNSTAQIYGNKYKKKSQRSSKYNSRGIRNVEKSLWNLDRTILNPELKLEWLKSQNWNRKEITNRGRLNNTITSKKTLIIGSGTLGASIAELLVRSGVNEMSIIDDDFLEIGNLLRHPLGLMQIGNSKAKELTKYLNHINPHARIKALHKEFKYFKEFNKEIDKYKLIIDCTGEDLVLDELEKFKFHNSKIFMSIFIGFKAKKLYLYLQKGNIFKSDNFREKTNSWLKEEAVEFSNYKFPREGTGCWSFVFPARYDDILLASSTAVKVLEDFTEKEVRSLITRYEQYLTSDGIFVGYKEC